MSSPQTAGEVVSSWSPGGLDIHHINTGRGDSGLWIMPDGTSLLIDAGNLRPGNPRHTQPRPDGSRTPGEWISRYVRHMLSSFRRVVLDYVIVTHFHADHLGEVWEDQRLSRSGRFRLTGITEVGESIPIRRIIDPGWPDYNYPMPLDDPRVQNYRAFLEYCRARGRLEVERFRPGVKDQIVPLRKPRRYPSFEIRNIAANGEIWTGVGTSTRCLFPPLEGLDASDIPTQNMCSIALRVRYGRFTYFCGGDLIGVAKEGVAPPFHDVETPVGQVVGPVDVSVATHHGDLTAQNANMISSLRPRVHILQVWSASHPAPSVLWRMLSTRLYPGPRDIFATNMKQETRIVIGPNIEKLKSDQGHILVRVEPGGDRYWVIVLDDSAETYQVKSVHGPYESRSGAPSPEEGLGR